MQIITVTLGICLLLGGLNLTRFSLRKVFSQQFAALLSQLTLTPLRGMVVGTLAAAIMQGSTGVTLTTIGLVSAEYLSFNQALGIILGANIGTCSTVGLLTLSLPPEYLLPILIVGGLTVILSAKCRFPALALLGMLAMFSGVSLLSGGLQAISKLDTVIACFAAAKSNPLYGIGGGILLTFLVQSSSAATGLLMLLSQQGVLELTTATYGIYGNNIGSCLSSLLVGATAPLSARRVAVAHIALNVLGVAAFFPLTVWLTKTACLLADEPAGQVAVIHTLFNILSSVAVLPIISHFSRLIILLVPGNDSRK